MAKLICLLVRWFATDNEIGLSEQLNFDIQFWANMYGYVWLCMYVQYVWKLIFVTVVVTEFPLMPNKVHICSL